MKKVINYMLNGKAIIICLIVGLVKKHCINQWILKSLGEKVKVELDLSNYATKVDLEMQQMLI